MVQVRTRLGMVIAILGMCGCSKSSSDQNPSPSATQTAVTFDAYYVVNGGSNSISVLDADSGAEKATFKLSSVSYPHHVNISPDGGMLMVSAPGMDLSAGHGGDAGDMKGTVLMIDAVTGESMKTKTLDGMSHNAAFSPDGKEIWASIMTMPGSLLIMDSSNLDVLKTIPVGDMPAEVTFSSDGKYAFVANGMSDSVSIVDVTTKELIKDIPVGADPVGAWPGSDNVMYVDNEKGKTITAIDANTLTVTRTYELGFTPGMASLAPSGELWVSDADNGRVVYFMKDSTMKMGVISTGKGAHAIAFSEDGRMAFVTNQAEATVTMVDVANHSVMKTIKVGDKPNGILFRKIPPRPLKI